MLERLKYRLLRWLLGDICMRSHGMCYGCQIRYTDEEDGSACCGINDILWEARRAWGLENVEVDECTTEQ